MSIFLLDLLSKWVSIILVTIVSIIPFSISESSYEIERNNDMILSVKTKIVEKEIDYQYSSKIPNNITKTIEEGQHGIIYIDRETNEELKVRKMEPKKLLVGTGRNGNYTGVLTGYGPDCPGCSPVGNVACRTRERRAHSLINDGLYYDDKDYGELRIVAASLNAFPCGTVVKVNNGVLDSFDAIVLDTGATMRKSWNEERTVWMDLAFNTQAEAARGNATSYNTKYNVQRWGW